MLQSECRTVNYRTVNQKSVNQRNVNQRSLNQRSVNRGAANETGRNAELKIVNVQRNPYLAKYDVHKSSGGSRREESSQSRARRRRIAERRRRAARRKMLLLLTGCGCVLVMVLLLYRTFGGEPQVDGSIPPVEKVGVLSGLTEKIQGLQASAYHRHPIWTEDFLTVNEYSRPGDALTEVNSIFVHYTANPGTSAAQNRSYFEQLKDTHERSASAHFIIGYEGEIVQCIPLDEIAYAVQTRNMDSISIECCYKAADGSFTQETYDSLIELLGWLTEVYDLETDDILRHYDCGGKKCPIYYTENEDAWLQLKEDVGNL